MPSAYTNLGIEKQATGENANSWGTITNTNFDIIDEALSGINSITSNDTSQTISAPSDGIATQQTRFATYIFNGSPSGAVTVTLPSSVKKVINVVNNYTQNITFQVGSGATTATVFPSSSGIIHTDGANAVYSVSEGSASHLRHNGTTKAEATANGIVITGTLSVSNLTLDTNSITSTNTDGNIIITPNGTGTIVTDSHIVPNTDSTDDLGTSTTRFANIYGDSVDAPVLKATNATAGTASIQIGESDDWTVEVGSFTLNGASSASADVLVFKHGGTPKLALDTAGNLIAVGDVTASGSIT
jgi:hypothetical protein